uniref:Uncharacterized protein n=1 Tax=Oryza punctata TaxID=4537 RepID=A0A0E0KPM3_ORYPU
MLTALLSGRLPWALLSPAVLAPASCSRWPESEKMMPISKLATPLAGFLGGFRRGGHHDEDGAVARP